MTALAPSPTETAFHRHGGLVYGAALRQLRDEHLAEDVAQAVFFVLARQSRPIPEERLAGWLLTTTRYCAKNALRSELRRRRHESSAAMERTNMAQQVDPADVEITDFVDEAMSRLRTRESTAIALRYLESRPMLEVAEVLGVTADAARKIVSRSLAKLRKILRRRGVVLPTAAALAVALKRVPAHAAPVSLSAAAPTISGVLLAKGALQSMMLGKIAGAAAVAVLAAGVGVAALSQLNSGQAQTPADVSQPPAAGVAARVDYLAGADSPFLQLTGCHIRQTLNLQINDQPHDASATWFDQQYNQVHWTLSPVLAAQATSYTITIAPADHSEPAATLHAPKTADTLWLEDLPARPGDYLLTLTADGPGTQVLGQAGAHVHVDPLPRTEICIFDYQPDGSLQFTFVDQKPGDSKKPVASDQFEDDEHVRYDAMFDEQGQPIQFQATHLAHGYEYRIPFNEPIPAGHPIMIAYEGLFDAVPTGAMTDLGSGQFRYARDEIGVEKQPDHRVQLHILPAGATLISLHPADLPHQVVNGRVQIYVDKIVAANQHNPVSIVYRLPPAR